MATAIRLAALLVLCGGTAWAGATLGLGFGSQTVARYVDLVQSLAWSTNAYEFGTKDVGATTTATFTLTNSGNDTAEDVATSVTGAGFRLYSSTTFGNISAGRTRVAKVAFTPTGAGAFSGFANYSAPNIGRKQIALSGTGVGPACTTDSVNAAVETGSGTVLGMTNKGYGQSFKVTSNGFLSSVSVNVAGTFVAGPLEVRWGDSANLDVVDNLHVFSKQITVSSIGWNKFTFDTKGAVSTAATYYWAAYKTSGTINLATDTANPYTDGTVRYAAATPSWNLTGITSGTDFNFRVNLCN